MIAVIRLKLPWWRRLVVVTLYLITTQTRNESGRVAIFMGSIAIQGAGKLAFNYYSLFIYSAWINKMGFV